MYNPLENFNYYNDPRVINAMAGSSYILGASKSSNQLFIDPSFLEYHDDGEGNHDPKAVINLVDKVALKGEYKGKKALIINAPIRNALCPHCEGDGTMVNPNIDCGGLSQEDFDDDPDFEEDYHSGRYDIQCSHCKGEKIVHAVNFDYVNEGSDVDLILKAVDEAEEDRYADAYERANELKWGY
tara:strand:- start:740 stop:1291 length:552 start_codon:yes stop_codon:yes gene_type:complete